MWRSNQFHPCREVKRLFADFCLRITFFNFPGLMLFLVSLLMLYIKRHVRDNDVDDDQDVYLIAREMHHRELALQKKNNVNSIPSIKDRPLLDQIPEHEI